VRRKTFILGCITAAALIAGSLGAFTTTAFANNAATNGTGHCDPSTPACGLNPVRRGPLPPFATLVGDCPSFLTSDTWTLAFASGNSVNHGTSNKNGDWGGGTAEGQATLTTSDGTVQYAGHLTEWGGGGNNSAGQSENGFTLTFNGTGIAGSVTIHADIHATTNNSGTPTADQRNITVACS
jgi:hypothetical protein